MRKTKKTNYYSYKYSDDDFIDDEETTLRKRFTPEEDRILKKTVKKGKLKTWEAISQLLPGRTARQCRDRYNNYLFKQITNAQWTEEEDQIIIKMYEQIGSKWTQIAKSLQGRSGNNVKNRWYKYLAKKYKSTTTHNEEKSEPNDHQIANIEDTSKQRGTTYNTNEKDDDIHNIFQNFDKIFDLNMLKGNFLGESFELFHI